jgi:hypothetical protein
MLQDPSTTLYKNSRRNIDPVTEVTYGGKLDIDTIAIDDGTLLAALVIDLVGEALAWSSRQR